MFFLLVFTVAIFIQGGCASQPQVHLPTEAVKLERESILKDQLSQKAEKHFTLKSSPAVEAYIARIIHQLMSASNPEERPAEVKVFLVDDQNGLWRSLSIPENRFFLSLGLLKTIEFEHELASLLSMQISILSRKVIFNLVSSSESSRDVSPPHHITWESLLNASLEEEQASIGPAIDLVYKAGFDPRGMVSLYDRYTLTPDHSPYRRKTRELYIEMMKQEISKLPPLRNPISRSEEFLLMKQRIKKL